MSPQEGEESVQPAEAGIIQKALMLGMVCQWAGTQGHRSLEDRQAEAQD